MNNYKSLRQRAIAAGYRSGLEEDFSKWLESQGVAARYEEDVVRYTPPVVRKRYTPDFVLPNGIVIETKGRFQSADRKKHIAVKAEHPHLDIRFVFSNPNAKIAKNSKTTYAMWCEKNGFQYASAKEPPIAWLAEPVSIKKLKAIEEASQK